MAVKQENAGQTSQDQHSDSAALRTGRAWGRESSVSGVIAVQRKPGARIDKLDGLRGVLALAVAISHILLWWGLAEAPVGGRIGRMWHSVISSSAAVETFYIHSGFAISFLIYARPQTFTGFLTGRFFRIYPVYLVCLGLSVVLMGFVPWLLETANWRGTSYFEAIRNLSVSEQADTGLHLASHVSLLNGLLPRQVLPNSAATFLRN